MKFLKKFQMILIPTGSWIRSAARRDQSSRIFSNFFIGLAKASSSFKTFHSSCTAGGGVVRPFAYVLETPCAYSYRFGMRPRRDARNDVPCGRGSMNYGCNKTCAAYTALRTCACAARARTINASGTEMYGRLIPPRCARPAPPSPTPCAFDAGSRSVFRIRFRVCRFVS